MGIFISVSPVQPQKALLPIAVTLSGIFTEVSPVQFSKALKLISVTLSGIVTEVSPVQSLKALKPIAVTGTPSISFGISTEVLPVPRVTFVIVMLLFSAVYSILVAVPGMAFPPTVAFAGNIRVLSDVQLKKANSPIDVTDLGIFTEVSPVHSIKTPLPIFLTPLEIFTEVSPVQLGKA